MLACSPFPTMFSTLSKQKSLVEVDLHSFLVCKCFQFRFSPKLGCLVKGYTFSKQALVFVSAVSGYNTECRPNTEYLKKYGIHVTDE